MKEEEDMFAAVIRIMTKGNLLPSKTIYQTDEIKYKHILEELMDRLVMLEYKSAINIDDNASPIQQARANTRENTYKYLRIFLEKKGIKSDMKYPLIGNLVKGKMPAKTMKDKLRIKHAIKQKVI